MIQLVASSGLALSLTLASIMSAGAQSPHGRSDPIMIEIALVGGPHGGGYYALQDALGIHGAFTKRLWIKGGQAVGVTFSAESFVGPLGDTCYLSQPGPDAECMPHLRGLQTLMLHGAQDLFGSRALGVTAGVGVISSHRSRTGGAIIRAELVPQRGEYSVALFMQRLIVPAFRGERLDLTLVGFGLHIR